MRLLALAEMGAKSMTDERRDGGQNLSQEELVGTAGKRDHLAFDYQCLRGVVHRDLARRRNAFGWNDDIAHVGTRLVVPTAA
jgi:hypothetical protein